MTVTEALNMIAAAQGITSTSTLFWCMRGGFYCTVRVKCTQHEKSVAAAAATTTTTTTTTIARKRQ